MMPAGKYYVGDLCYVMHPEWDECCELFFEGRSDHGCNDGEFTLADGRRFASYGTAYGDGTYYSSHGTSHSVDAGLIGCILVNDIRDDTYAELSSLGAIIDFPEPFETSSDAGVIKFGHIRIDTGDDYSDCEDDDDGYGSDW